MNKQIAACSRLILERRIHALRSIFGRRLPLTLLAETLGNCSIARCKALLRDQRLFRYEELRALDEQFQLPPCTFFLLIAETEKRRLSNSYHVPAAPGARPYRAALFRPEVKSIRHFFGPHAPVALMASICGVSVGQCHYWLRHPEQVAPAYLGMLDDYFEVLPDTFWDRCAWQRGQDVARYRLWQDRTYWCDRSRGRRPH